MFGKLLSDMMIKPGNSPVFNNPSDFGLEYEEIEFSAVDGTVLRGWLIPGSSDKVIIQTHFGVQCSRAGYTPKGKGPIKLWKQPITFLRQAKYLQGKGYTVLMYDMRNHGESELGVCPWVSWGPEEAKDVVAAVSYAVERYPEAGLGLLSICMGAASSTYAYGQPEKGLSAYPQLKAMIAVQPLHYSNFVRAFGIPAFLERSGSAVSLERTGIDMHKRTFLPDVRKISVPTLVVQNRNDPWTDLDFVQRYFDNLTVEKELLWLDLVKSRGAAYDHLGSSPEFLHDFFGRYL